MKISDFVDQCLNMGSILAAVCILIVTIYWCSLSYGIMTILQIYGNVEGTAILANNSVIASVILLPLIPAFLVLARFVPWEKTIQRIFRK